MSDELSKDFIDICLRELAHMGRSGGSLKKETWEKLAENLHAKHGYLYTKRQLKNHWDYLRKKYQCWRKLDQKSGRGIDVVSGAFTFSDDVWDDLIKHDSFASQFRYGPFEHKEELIILFHHSSANPSYQASSSNPPMQPPSANPSYPPSSSNPSMQPTNQWAPSLPDHYYYGDDYYDDGDNYYDDEMFPNNGHHHFETTKLADSDFFNSFQDDFDDANIN